MVKPLKVIAGAADKPIVINGVEIPCYVLEDGTRVLTQTGMFSGLGLASRSGNVRVEDGSHMPRFATSKALALHIGAETRAGLTSPILFEYQGKYRLWLSC